MPSPRRWRTSDLPQTKKYAQIRGYVLRRDSFCKWGSLPEDGVSEDYRCPERSTEVDHLRDPNVHEPWNLRGICASHHATRTGRQGAQARHALPNLKKRPEERHPGFK